MARKDRAVALKKRAAAKASRPPPRPKRPNGRPPSLVPDDKTIATIRGLGQIQATTKECAAVLAVTEMTFFNFLNRHPKVREEYDRAREVGRVSLRRTQLRMAERNPAMAIFLGKNLLGQKDRHDIDGRFLSYDLRSLTNEQLELLASIFPTSGDFGGGYSGGEAETIDREPARIVDGRK